VNTVCLQVGVDLFDQRRHIDVHQAPVLGRSVVTDPAYGPISRDENERVTWLPTRL